MQKKSISVNVMLLRRAVVVLCTLVLCGCMGTFAEPIPKSGSGRSIKPYLGEWVLDSKPELDAKLKFSWLKSKTVRLEVTEKEKYMLLEGHYSKLSNGDYLNLKVVSPAETSEALQGWLIFKLVKNKKGVSIAPVNTDALVNLIESYLISGEVEKSLFVKKAKVTASKSEMSELIIAFNAEIFTDYELLVREK